MRTALVLLMALIGLAVPTPVGPTQLLNPERDTTFTASGLLMSLAEITLGRPGGIPLNHCGDYFVVPQEATPRVSMYLAEKRRFRILPIEVSQNRLQILLDVRRARPYARVTFRDNGFEAKLWISPRDYHSSHCLAQAQVSIVKL